MLDERVPDMFWLGIPLTQEEEEKEKRDEIRNRILTRRTENLSIFF